jgi:putative oxidoreductase
LGSAVEDGAKGMLLVRLIVGAVLFAHGAQKLVEVASTGDRGETVAFMTNLGFRSARRTTVFVGCSQAIGGMLIAVGLVLPLAGVIVVATMVVAVLATRQAGFWSQAGGWEYPAVLGIVTVGLVAAGPGAVSLDRLLGTSWFGWKAATVCGVVAVLAAATTWLTLRRRS